MPSVGKKKFAYTDEGRKKAYMEAAKTNEPIQNITNYDVEHSSKPNMKMKSKIKPYKLKRGI